MKQENNIYRADDGKLIVRKSDGFVMGDAIDLGENDSIDNYFEKEFTEEEIKEFFESVGIILPEKETYTIPESGTPGSSTKKFSKTPKKPNG